METLNIKDWAVEDRPREKLYSKGAKTLTDAELLAIILSSGTRSRSAVQLAQEILLKSDQSLDVLATKKIQELCKIKGIGHAKAIAIKAVMELSNRRSRLKVNKQKITCSADSYQELRHHYLDLEVEEFWILYLNRSNQVLGKERISIGGVSGTIVDPKVVFKHAVSLLATGIILSHNHPSGNLQPSSMDKAITKKLASAGENLDIKVYDHLIVAGDGYLSFADEGLL